MHRSIAAIRRPCPVVAAARAWLALGALVVLLVPDARDPHPLIGWLPFWLVAAPAVALAALRMLREPGWPWRALRRGLARAAERRGRAQALPRRS
jgi:hypothetical protein